MTAPDPTVRTPQSRWRIRARAQHQATTTWYAETAADARFCERILRTDYGTGARRVTVETI
jgi:hypothetical protein